MPDVLVTGAGTGIGLATTERLASSGHRVIGIGRRPAPAGFPGVFVRCDLTDAARTAEVLAEICGSYEITRVVNNAGMVGRQSIEELDLATFQEVLDVNLRAAVQVVQAALPGMRERGFGRIVSVASRAVHGSRERTAYSAAKSALVGCTRSWALELAPYGITSNAVAPGPVATELFRLSHPVGSAEAERIVDDVPLGRLGEPAEIAAAICFLLSDDAGFITGHVLNVDGGASLPAR